MANVCVLQFNDNLIRHGIEGGKHAAATLRTTALQHYSELTDDIEVAAKVYANCGGLMNAMLRDGCLSDIDHFKNFMIGFTQGKASFDFVDVGHGKERADSKIKGMQKTLREIQVLVPRCGMLLSCLSASHANKY